MANRSSNIELEVLSRLSSGRGTEGVEVRALRTAALFFVALAVALLISPLAGAVTSDVVLTRTPVAGLPSLVSSHTKVSYSGSVVEGSQARATFTVESSLSKSRGGGVGTTKTITVAGKDKYSVRLTRVIDPAQPARRSRRPKAGERYVAAVFTVKDSGDAKITGDANEKALIIGSDNDSYTPISATISKCTNFDYGEFRLAPGRSVSGCVVFQIPTTVAIAEVRWSPAGAFDTVFVQWKM